MADKFLTQNPARPGTSIEVVPVEVGGAPSAQRIPRLNAAGELDVSMIPSSVGGAGTLTCTASEALIVGPVDVYNNAGVLSARKADATSGSVKPADGYVKQTYSSGAADVVVFRQGNVTGLSGLTIGGDVFLGKTPGTFVQSVAGYGAGDFVQKLGLAVSATAVLFELGDPGIELA